MAILGWPVRFLLSGLAVTQIRDGFREKIRRLLSTCHTGCLALGMPHDGDAAS
jgi:hypothetical protein